jgi:polyphenol oxidase
VVGSTGGTNRLARWVGQVAGSASGRGQTRWVLWLDQVHGAEVVTVTAPATTRVTEVGPGPSPPGVVEVGAGRGDSLVSDLTGSALCVLTADCAPLALGSEEGVFAAVHAGWRGIVAGVVEATVAAMRSKGAGRVVGSLGPCIHPGCYEFSDADLSTVATAYGDGVRGTTSDGRPALDLPAAVSAALAAAGAIETTGVDACTACCAAYFSHRGRGDIGRQAMVVWSQGHSAPVEPGQGEGDPRVKRG